MAKLDFGKLKKMQEDLSNRGSGNDLFFSQKNIGEETHIRILPPLDNMEGSYFYEEIGFWFKGTRYASPLSFGLPCAMDEEIKAARALKDPDIDALLKNWKLYKKSSVFFVPILVLDCKFDEDTNELLSYKVIDNKPKILQCGTELIRHINRIAIGRQFQVPKSDYGFCDPERGFNISLSKTGKELDTEYSAIGWNEPMSIAEKFLKDTPDVIKSIKDSLKSNEYLRMVVRNFLYGEEITKIEPKKPVTEPETSDDDVVIVKKQPVAEPEKQTPKPVKTTSKTVIKKSLLASLDEEDED